MLFNAIIFLNKIQKGKIQEKWLERFYDFFSIILGILPGFAQSSVFIFYYIIKENQLFLMIDI